MKSPLKRILQLRSLLEEASRNELEKRLRVFHTLDTLQRAELDSAAVERRHAAEVLTSASEAVTQTLQPWRQAHVVGGLAVERAAKLAPILETAKQRIAVGREEYMERRKERRQVATILEERERVRQREALRREQATLDDWFAIRPR